MKIPPPEGISDEDYDAIEAAVMETARGRWFLAEFSRRGRADEMRQMLEALTRLERVVASQKAPPSEPALRLLVQRLIEVATDLDGLGNDMRAQGVGVTLCGRIEAQARAIHGLLHLNAPPSAHGAGSSEIAQASPMRVLPKASKESEVPTPAVHPLSSPAQPIAPAASARPAASPAERQAARHSALARLDALPIDEKLALFA